MRPFDRSSVPSAPTGWNVSAVSKAEIDALARLLDESPGPVPVVLHIGGESERVARGIAAAAYVRNELEAIFGHKRVWEA